MGQLNLGILAHVDAGKTTLTERILYEAGAIDRVGRVDSGTTQTDSMDLERRRGITIRAAVAAFSVGDVNVNLIDTPGHPDFIAEVDRSLGVLDGAVLVVSAVEGVQAQTVVLWRAIRRLRLPVVIFVNKIDRSGADPERALDAMSRRLETNIVPMGVAHAVGSAAATVAASDWGDPSYAAMVASTVALHDDELLGYVLANHPIHIGSGLRRRLAAATMASTVHPVFFGSAATGAGVAELVSGVGELLTHTNGDADGPPSAAVFKVDHTRSGQRLAYLRLYSGSVRVRDRPTINARGVDGPVTLVDVFERAGPASRPAATAGQIAVISGLRSVRVGDTIGTTPRPQSMFPPPTLRAVVVPLDRRRRGDLHRALTQLADVDPLIALRYDNESGELLLSLYGEVHQQVIGQLLAEDHGIAVEFRDTHTVCVERPTGCGEAVELLRRRGNPFLATVGLRVEPAPPGTGIIFRLDVPVVSVPMYVYKTVDAFTDAMHNYVSTALQQGLHGWEVTDCVVTMTACDYVPPGTKAAAYRKLTPLVLFAALDQAGTAVCEPIDSFRLDVPTDTLATVTQLVTRHRGQPGPPITSGDWVALPGEIPSANIERFRRRLGGVTRGEGVLETALACHRPVVGEPPARRRHGPNPLNRADYLRVTAR